VRLGKSLGALHGVAGLRHVQKRQAADDLGSQFRTNGVTGRAILEFRDRLPRRIRELRIEPAAKTHPGRNAICKRFGQRGTHGIDSLNRASISGKATLYDKR
jgi:hypothetical protein